MIGIAGIGIRVICVRSIAVGTEEQRLKEEVEGKRDAESS